MIRHLFIVNPKAGVKSPVEEITERIRRAFILNTDRENEKYEILLTQKKGDATEFARAACREPYEKTRIYACGGDGTFHEVINGGVGADSVAVCPVPVGSGNDFIRTLEGFSKEDFLDLSACIRGTEIPCDVLRCGDVYSLNSISVGLDAITARRQNRIKKLPLISGGAAYKISLGYTFLSSMNNPVSFEVDGEALSVGNGSVTLAVVANGRYYGGGFKAAPLAEINDGLMDFVTIHSLSRMEFLRYVKDYKEGKHLETVPDIYFTRCKRIRLLSEKPLCLQADGEIFQMENPEIEIIPAAVRLVLPAR